MICFFSEAASEEDMPRITKARLSFGQLCRTIIPTSLLFSVFQKRRIAIISLLSDSDEETPKVEKVNM